MTNLFQTLGNAFRPATFTRTETPKQGSKLILVCDACGGWGRFADDSECEKCNGYGQIEDYFEREYDKYED